MADSSVDDVFNMVVEALEKGQHEEALQITEANCGRREFVVAQDARDGHIDGRFEYRYHPQPRRGYTLLHYAMLYDHVDMIRMLILHGADPLQVDKGFIKSSPLHIGCLFGEQNTIHEFISILKVHCADKVEEVVNKPNGFCWCPLYYAAERKKIGVVKLLLENGADPNREYGSLKGTALTFFCSFSSPECVKELLHYTGRRKVDIHQKTCEGSTPLHFACKQKNEAIVRLLLEYGADPNVLNDPNPPADQQADRVMIRGNPLHVAMHHYAVDCMYSILESPRLNLKSSDQKYDSLLKLAVELDEPKMLLKILEKHDPTYSMKGSTLLHDVVRSEAYSEEDFTRAAKMLGKKCIECEDGNKRTPLMLAAMLNKHRKLNILQKTYLSILRENFFFPDHEEWKYIYQDLIGKRDENGDCAVHLAAKHDGLDTDFERTVKVLDQLREAELISKVPCLKEQRDRDPLILRNRDGLTGLQVAIQCGKAERAVILLKVSEGRLTETASSTIIHFALEHKISAVEFEKLLITLEKQHKSTLLRMLSVKNELGKTALMTALESKLSQHAELLIQIKDADGGASFINARDSNNKNALRIAIENGCPSDLITKLMDRSSDIHDHTPHGHVPIDENTHLSNVKAVLEHRRGEITETGDRGEKLLEAAIKAKRPDIIKFLLVKKARVSHQHLQQVIVENENEEFAKMLVRYAYDPSDILQELDREREEGVVFFHELIRKMPDVAEEALYRSAELDDNGAEMLLDGYHSAAEDGGNQLQVEVKTNPPNYAVEKTLEVMVRHKRLKLLQHPVVYRFIQSKWLNFGLPLYSLQLLCYLFFIIPLSLLALLPTSTEVTHEYTNGLAALVIGVTFIHLIILAVIQFPDFKNMKLVHLFIPTRLKAKLLFQCLVFLLALVFACLTIFNTHSGCCVVWRWHSGLAAVSCGWVNLILLFFKFPFVGEHAIIFATTVVTFLKLAVFALLLILASTIVLMMIFFDAQALQSPFYNFRRSFVTVLTMVTGELGYNEAFGLSYEASNNSDVSSNIMYPETANLVWAVFLVLIPILLTNMLTGLAVGDVIELHQHAALTQLEQKVKLVTYAEDVFRICARQRLGRKMQLKCFDRLRGRSQRGKDLKENEDILSYIKVRKEEVKDVRAESSTGEYKRDVRIIESIENIKTVSLSCERKIREFKDVYDDTINKLKNENSKIRKHNEQLVCEMKKLQQMVTKE